MSTQKVKRESKNILSDSQLKFFYEDILLISESDDVKSYGDYDQIKKIIAATSDISHYDLVYKDYEKEMKSPKDNTIYFSAESSNSNNGKKRNVSVVRKLFKHLRDAFAHNYITMDGNDWVFRDYDYNQSNKLTLYAKINSFDEFQKLITTIKSFVK